MQDASHELYVAAERGDVQECIRLFSKGADNVPSGNGLTPFRIAAQKGHTHVCSLFLDRGISPESGMLPAIASGHTDVCRLLLDAGVDPNSTQDGLPLLQMSIVFRRFDVCSLLLSRGAKHEKNDETGATPLRLVSSLGCEDICQQLLDAGATHEPDDDGSTPLHAACSEGRDRVCALLLEKGADVNSQDKRGKTPLDALNAANFEIWALRDSENREDGDRFAEARRERIRNLLVARGAIVGVETA